MEIIHYQQPINIEQLTSLIDAKKRTLLIIPSKYHSLIYHSILNKNKIIYNFSMMNPNSFLKSVLSENNLVIDDDLSLIIKNKINNELINNNHHFQNNLNFINELFKLKQELFYSNIEYDNLYHEYLNHQPIKLNDASLSINYDTIIYCDEDFFAIHQQLLEQLKTDDVITIKNDSLTNKAYYEHSNVIRMLDYIIKDIYEKDFEELLIIVDDFIQQDYLIKELTKLNIPITNLNKINNLETTLIQSLFRIINHQYNDYDLKNLQKYNLNLEDLLKLIDEDYHTYIKKLYDILYQTKILDLNYLNKLFTKLYLLENANKNLLNKLLVNGFINHLTNPSSLSSKIILANSSFTSLSFKNVIVVDASLKKFNAASASYLLNTKQRQEISDKLISNTNYLEMFHLTQDRLLTCGTNIMFHYSLLTLENKSQNIATFIKLASNQEQLELKNINENYLHLSIVDKKEDSLLIDNQTQSLNLENMLKNFKNEIRISASAMDEFYSCPYKFLVSRVYRPKYNDDFSYLTVGNIQHKVIEIINNTLIEAQQTIDKYPYDKLIKIIDIETNNLIDEDNKTNYDKVNKNEIKKRIKANLTNYIDSMIYFQPFTKFNINSSEKVLKFDYPNPYFINTYLIGKIDAIMSYDNLSYVLDYKASQNTFKEKDFNKGKSNQLIMYLKLLKENNYTPYGAFYKAIRDDFINLKIEDLHKTKSLYKNINDLAADLEHVKLSHNLKNPYYGLYLKNCDRTLIDSNQNDPNINDFLVSNAKNDDFNDYLTTLDTHIEAMLKVLAQGKFNIEPLDNDSCQYCNYKVICKYYYKKGVDDEEGNEDESE